MHTILGAGGVIATELVKELVSRRKSIRLVARNPKPAGTITRVVAADLSMLDQTVAAVAGSSVVYLVAGLKYDVSVWRELWPRIMRNAIEASKRANAKLIFFDNVYMYGKVSGPMTEDTPFNPVSRKGEIRAQVATMLLEEMKVGGVQALIARSADFFMARAREPASRISSCSTSWLSGRRHRGSSTTRCRIPSRSRRMLGVASSCSAPAKRVGTRRGICRRRFRRPREETSFAWPRPSSASSPRYRVLTPLMLKLVGVFSSDVRGVGETLYQYNSPYVFDSTKFTKAFGFGPAAYADGVEETALAYKTTR